MLQSPGFDDIESAKQRFPVPNNDKCSAINVCRMPHIASRPTLPVRASLDWRFRPVSTAEHRHAGFCELRQFARAIQMEIYNLIITDYS